MDDTGKRAVGLYAFPWKNWRGRGLKGLYSKGLRNKANPRDAAYMQALLAERLPDAQFVNTDEDGDWRSRIDAAESVVLLYPDPLGLGQQTLDVAAVSSEKEVWVLNGRRRLFPLDRETYREIRRRRFWERTMLPEVVATVCFVIASPFLLIADWGRGKW
jgi:hypothetical protein